MNQLIGLHNVHILNLYNTTILIIMNRKFVAHLNYAMNLSCAI